MFVKVRVGVGGVLGSVFAGLFDDRGTMEMVLSSWLGKGDW